MGRPLKIRKYNGGGVVDDGFPNDGTTNNGYDDNQPGVVGGIDEDSDQIRCQANILVKGLGTITTDSTSTTVTGTGTHFTTDALNSDSQIWVADGAGGYASLGTWDSTTDDDELELAANAGQDLTDTAWYYTANNDASIVRQKGAKKFLIAGTDSSIQDESIAAGQAYMINSVSNTDWEALGAGPDAGQYKIFTATADGTGLATNGTVWPIAVCTLVNEADPTNTPNTMSIAINDDGSTYYASRIKNKFVLDFTDNGTDENPGTAYSATFFNDSGNTLPNPATSNDRVYTLVGIENWC